MNLTYLTTYTESLVEREREKQRQQDRDIAVMGFASILAVLISALFLR